MDSLFTEPDMERIPLVESMLNVPPWLPAAME